MVLQAGTADAAFIARQHSPQALAFLGDAVFEAYVRTQIIARHAGTSRGMHRLAISVVNARAQAEMANILLPLLTEQEAEVFRRGRNAAPHNPPASASLAEYRLATALEAVCGYLYLSGQQQRLESLLETLLADRPALQAQPK